MNLASLSRRFPIVGLIFAASVLIGCSGAPRSLSDAPPLAVVAIMDAPPGNIAIARDSRIFVSMHPFGDPTYSVREVMPDGSSRPFPPGPWSGKPDADGVGLASVIGIEADTNGRLWMLDMGDQNLPPRLVAWNLLSDRLDRVVSVAPPASVSGGFPQDFAIDERRNMIYIADMGLTGFGGVTTPAIIAVDLATGTSRRLLENAAPLRAEPDAAMVIDGRTVTALGADGLPFTPSLGLNPITIDEQAEWVVFGAMHGRTLYRVRAADLANVSLTPAELASRVQRLGPKPVSDGITIDRAGNVYATDVNNNAISVTTPDGQMRVLIRDDQTLNWPDGLSFGPDGMLYVTVNQLHRHAPLNAGRSEQAPPFRIVRVRPLAPGAQGR